MTTRVLKIEEPFSAVAQLNALDNDQYPRCVITDGNNNIVQTLDLALVSGQLGRYSKLAAMAEAGYYTAAYTVYTDSGYSIENTDYDLDDEILQVLPIGERGPTGPSGDAIWNVKTITTTPYTISKEVNFVDCTSAAITVTLPAAASNEGHIYFIKKIDSTSNTVTITASELIDGESGFTLYVKDEAVTLSSDGSNWYILG